MPSVKLIEDRCCRIGFVINISTTLTTNLEFQWLIIERNGGDAFIFCIAFHVAVGLNGACDGEFVGGVVSSDDYQLAVISRPEGITWSCRVGVGIGYITVHQLSVSYKLFIPAGYSLRIGGHNRLPNPVSGVRPGCGEAEESGIVEFRSGHTQSFQQS